MLHVARSCWSSASERKKRSIGVGRGRSSSMPRRNFPPRTSSASLGGIRWAWLGSSCSRPALCTCVTGIVVWRLERSGRRLTCVGARRTMTTNPLPRPAGIAEENRFSGSSHPAEAPIATMGTRCVGPRPSAARTGLSADLGVGELEDLVSGTSARQYCRVSSDRAAGSGAGLLVRSPTALPGGLRPDESVCLPIRRLRTGTAAARA